jgi:Bacterial membrane protein YfhO
LGLKLKITFLCNKNFYFAFSNEKIFMKSFNFKKVLPHLIALAIFLTVAVVYCKPALEGKVVSQQDIQGWRGMSQQSVEFNEKYGYHPLWSNSMFSGMPAYQIFLDARTHILVGYFGSILTLGLPKPMSYFFLACICFYIFCLVAGANPWVSIMGALSYAYCTFDPVIINVGHDTEMISIGYVPGVLAGLLLLFQKKYWAGFAVTSLFASLLIGQNHLQMVYYTLIIAAIMAIAFFIKSYREKQPGVAVKSLALGLVAGIVGLACSAVTMLPTYEYAKESTRGGRSELTSEDAKDKTKGGLDKSEAFRWSYGIGETFTFMIPDLYGGGTRNKESNSSSKFVEKLTEAGVPEDSAIQNANYSSYWGDQPTTAGPVYLGAIICFLFIFGLFYVKSWHKSWLVATSALAILLAWGANLKGINYFLFDHLPFYNKFRAVTMSLVIPQFCFSVLAVLAVSRLVTETDWNDAWKKLRLSVYVTGAILLILFGFYFTSGFTGAHDKDMKDGFKKEMLQQVPPGQQPSPQLLQQADDFSRGLITALHEDRKSLLGGDLLRAILLIGLAVVLMGLYTRQKIKPVILIAGLIVLSSYDLLSVANRYLNSDSFVEDSDFESAFTPSEADQQISKDPDHDNFRIFDQTSGAPFQDSRPSFHHNSVGGYHPAILGLYNDIIEGQLEKGNERVYNMLNTKYFIIQNPQTGKPVAQLNPAAFGNAWLVKGIKYVNNADEEMDALDSTDLKDTAVVDKKYQSQIRQIPVPDSSAFIKLKQNLNDKIDYTFHSTTPQFAVLSEVYYPRGWNAFIDGQKADYVKTNYVLRGMYVPAGDHQIEFRFEPKSYTIGRTITIIANIFVFLSMIVAVIYYARRKRKPDAHVL